MQPEAESLLEAMIIAADLVAGFVERISEEAYLGSSLHRSAVERQLFIIGEALSQLSHVDAKAFEAIANARGMVSVRDVLAHGNGQIEGARVWEVLQNDLRTTIADVSRLLEKP